MRRWLPLHGRIDHGVGVTGRSDHALMKPRVEGEFEARQWTRGSRPRPSYV